MKQSKINFHIFPSVPTPSPPYYPIYLHSYRCLEALFLFAFNFTIPTEYSNRSKCNIECKENWRKKCLSWGKEFEKKKA